MALFMSFASCDGETANDKGTDTKQTEISDAGNGDNTSDGGATNTVLGGYVFSFNNTDVRVDEKAADVVDKLGTYTYFEAPSCAFNGLDKIYTYSSFEIDTYPIDDVDYISAVIFKDDIVETAEGICIGMKKDKVVSKYGDPTEESGTLAIYEKDNMQLRFIYDEDGYVVSIQYMSKKI